MYDFKMNTNPFGPPKWLTADMFDISYLIDYPDYKNTGLIQSISNLLKLPCENVSPANGSLEAIFAIASLVSNKKCGIVLPTYWGYAAALDSVGVKYDRILLDEKDDFQFDLTKLHEFAKKGTLLYICNPNNPTGTKIKKDDLINLINSNPSCHFFIDEAHQILREDFDKETVVNEVTNHDNLTVIYSTSKLYNIGGFRTGIIASNSELINKFRKWQVPYSITTLQQVIFPKLLEDTKFLLESKKAISKSTKNLAEGLRKFGWLKVYDTESHFILCKILSNDITALKLSAMLEEDGFGIRECTTSYPELIGEWVRITSNTPENNNKLLETLKGYNIS